MSDERLQKLLARAGHGSRRSAESLIEAGRVRVNGAVITELGAKADPDRDLITLDNQPLEVPDTRRTFAFYKPESVVTTMRDPEGRKCVGDFVSSLGVRVFPVGRLDWDAEGLLLLTSDGELAHRLMHPRWGVKRTYLAKVKGDPTPEALQRLVSGVKLDDGDGRAIEASFERATDKNAWVKVVVREGRNHFVKRLCEAIGHPVQRLFRVEYAGVRLGTLGPGRFRELGANEVRELLAATAEEAPRPAGDLRRAPRPRPAQARDERGGARRGRAEGTGGRRASGEGERTSEGGSFGDRKSGGSFGDRKSGGSFGDRKSGGSLGDRKSGGSFGDRKSGGSFGDRRPSSDRGSFGDRKSGGSFGDRRPSSDRGSFGDRKSGGSLGDRKSGGSFGERRPSSDRGSFGDRKSGGSFGDRRPSSDRGSFGDRKSGGSFGDRKSGGSFGDRRQSSDRGSSGGRKPSGGGRSGGSPRGAKPRGSGARPSRPSRSR